MKNRNVISGKQRLVSGLKEEEGVRERLALVHTKPLDVFHVSLPELAMVPIEEMKREERPKVESPDPYKVREVLDDCEKQPHLLLGKPDCNRCNPLHSTATESELPQPGDEYSFLGNILGTDKSGIRITTHPNMV